MPSVPAPGPQPAPNPRPSPSTPGTPQLSVIVVVGERQRRALDSICAQSCLAVLEIVVVDVLLPSGARASRLVEPAGPRIVRVDMPATASLGQLRAEGARHSSAPAVAFIDDHCYPAPGWAQAVIDCHTGPWPAVGYAMLNANPQGYSSRSGFMAD